MRGMLRSCDYILTLHGGCFCFRSASPSAAILNNILNKILNKTTAVHKKHRSTQIKSNMLWTTQSFSLVIQ